MDVVAADARRVPYVSRGYYDRPLELVVIVDGLRYVLQTLHGHGVAQLVGSLPQTAQDLILAGAIISILLNPVLFSAVVAVLHRRRP